MAVATPVIAALFNPLRKRVQHAVDLDTIRGDLVGVVHEAFQPAHMSVWLPGAGLYATVPAPARTGVDQPEGTHGS